MKTIKLTKTGGGDYPALNIDRNNTLKKGITNGMIEMNKAFKIIWNTARGGYVCLLYTLTLPTNREV